MSRTWTGILTLVVPFLASAAFAEDALVDAFKRDVAHYRTLPEAKALALAADENGAVWGWASEHGSIDEALRAAADQCQAQAALHGVEADCRIVMIGNSPVAAGGSSGGGGAVPSQVPSAPSSPQGIEAPEHDPSQETEDAVVYSEQWVEGRRFHVASSGETQVWFSLDPGDRSRALVYVVNGEDRPVTLDPGGIRASYWKLSKPEDRHPVLAYSAEEWARRVRRKQAFAAAMAGVAAGLNSVPQPQTSYYQGRATAWGPGGSATANYYGTVTTWPTWQDYANAQARSQAQLRAVGEQLRESYAALTSNLLQRHTLESKGYYGGVVHFQSKIRGDRAFVRVPFAGEDFEFGVETRER